MDLKEEPLNSMYMEREDVKQKLDQKDKRIADLETEIRLLNLDLKTVDDELEKIRESKIPLTIVTRQQTVDFVNEMIKRSLHSLMITTPTISDLAKLDLYDVKSSVSIKACCNIEPNPEDQEILQELEALGNTRMRNFTSKDRWVCFKDNEELFIATVGGKGIGAFYCDDYHHIRFFTSLGRESWSNAQKL